MIKKMIIKFCANQVTVDDQKGRSGAIQKEDGKADEKTRHSICDHRRRLRKRKGACYQSGFYRGSADKTEKVIIPCRGENTPAFFVSKSDRPLGDSSLRITEPDAVRRRIN